MIAQSINNIFVGLSCDSVIGPYYFLKMCLRVTLFEDIEENFDTASKKKYISQQFSIRIVSHRTMLSIVFRIKFHRSLDRV